MNKVIRIGGSVNFNVEVKSGMKISHFNEMIREGLADGVAREIVKAIEDEHRNIKVDNKDSLFYRPNETYTIELMVATPDAFEAEIARQVSQRLATYKDGIKQKLNDLVEGF